MHHMPSSGNFVHPITKKIKYFCFNFSVILLEGMSLTIFVNTFLPFFGELVRGTTFKFRLCLHFIKTDSATLMVPSTVYFPAVLRTRNFLVTTLATPISWQQMGSQWPAQGTLIL